MIAKNFLPTSDEKLANWLQTFINVATPNKAQLGLTDTDLLDDNNNLANILAELSNVQTAAAAAKAAVKAKKIQRAIAVAAIRAQNKRIQIQPGVPDNLLVALGLPVHQKPGTAGSVAPVTPITVSAKPHVSGTNTVKWKAGGNKPGTIYVVQAMTPTPGAPVAFEGDQPKVADSAWTYVTSVNAAKFVHTGCVPGQTMYYRIIAQRGPKASVPSAAVVVYGP